MGMLTNYVQVGDVREHYQTGTSRDYDEWMSDDNATDDFEGTMDHFGAVTSAKDEATERATKEVERRAQLRSDVDANTERSKANASSIGDLNKEPEDPAPTPDANLQEQFGLEKPESPESPGVFDEPAAQQAKSKAQAYQSNNGGFQAGDVSSIKSTMEKPSATASEAPAQAAIYGNVTPDAAADEHANNLLTKYKSGIKYGQG